MSKGVLVDIPKCIGCKSCMVSCKSWNNLPAEPSSFVNTWDSPGKSDADTWTVVGYHIVEDGHQLKWRFVKRQCMHCNEPACESACFTHSFVKTREGAVIYKPTEIGKDYCVGCRYCMVACPFGVPSFEWEKTFPFVEKCRFCYDRLKEGVAPACVTSCPTGTLTFGNREELLAEARGRLGKNPHYVQHIYGEKEYGGTSWLYISDVPFEKLGFRTNVSDTAIPSYTWNVLKHTPTIFFGWGAILVGLYAYNKRRTKVQHEEDLYEPVEKERD